eukprot:1182299-Amorphochlora_amoeboformis.AAC.1
MDVFQKSEGELFTRYDPQEKKEGWLKKLGGKLGGGSWQMRYFRVDSVGRKLSWFKSATEKKAQGQ